MITQQLVAITYLIVAIFHYVLTITMIQLTAREAGYSKHIIAVCQALFSRDAVSSHRQRSSARCLLKKLALHKHVLISLAYCH